MKYIIFECQPSLPLPILFPEHIQHSMIAQRVKAEYPGYIPASAGFCGKEGGVWGNSISLNLKSRAEDSYWIKKTLGIDT